MKIKTFLKPFLTGQVFLLVIFTVVSNGQTHIKDQIEIKPKQLSQYLPDYLFMKPDTAKFVPFKYDESMGKELINERTLHRKVFLQPDGTKKARIYASPIHYRDEYGKFKDINDSITSKKGSVNKMVSSPNLYTKLYYSRVPLYGMPDYWLPVGSADFQFVSEGSVVLCDDEGCFTYEYPIVETVGVTGKSLIKFDINEIPSNQNVQDASLIVYYGTGYFCLNAIVDTLCAAAAECSSNAPPLHEYCVLMCPGNCSDTGASYQYISASIITDSTDWWDSNNYLPTYEDTVLFDIFDFENYGKKVFNVTNAIKLWHNGVIDNHGLILQSAQITDARRMFFMDRSDDYGYYGPYLEVTYTDSVEPKLRIIEPDTTITGECILPYLDENLPPDQIYPVMPQVTCKAVFDGLSNLTTDTVDVNWEYIVEYDFTRGTTYTYRRTGNYNFTGISQFSSPNDTTAWLVQFTDQLSNPKYIGGNVTVIASVEINGTTYSDTLNNVYEILGQNPIPENARLKAEEIITNYDFTNMYNLTGIKYKIWTILYEESKFRQFEWQYPFFGYPEWGYPQGMGIGQLDNPEATEGQLWDWVANLDGVIALFEDKIGSLNKYVDDVRLGEDIYTVEGEPHDRSKYFPENGFPGATDFSTNPTNDEANINWHQLYVGHHYYVWEPEDKEIWNGLGKWVVNPIIQKKGYDKGKQRDSLDKNLINGIYPNYWNLYLKGCTQ